MRRLGMSHISATAASMPPAIHGCQKLAAMPAT